jgi:ribosomal protein S12 methylthiotransferase accessory factor
VAITIHLPEGFPERYKAAVERTASLCAVKKHIMDPPEFTIEAKLG